jgi:amidophosphoribosyltransferase
MSDAIKHECGIAMIRLLKPLDFYIEKYGTPLYGINSLYLLMEKQLNRGQDGAGIASIKFDVEPGSRYISRTRAVGSDAVKNIFGKVINKYQAVYKSQPKNYKNGEWIKNNMAFAGETLLGHLRYGTFGNNSLEYCHPFLRQNNWKTRNLVLAGNFNLTNTDELFNELIRLGQHPKEKADTVTVMEKIGHFLDEENDKLYYKYKNEGYNHEEITSLITDNLDIPQILKDASKRWDGGYAMAGLFGHGDAFVLRDPNGIRPVYYYYNDEIAIVTSERPAIQTVLNIRFDEVKELTPGSALIIKKNGDIAEVDINGEKERKACSFERIYFSRGRDADIYKERMKLGYQLSSNVLTAINHDLTNTVLSYIPNTAEVAFRGLIEGLVEKLNEKKQQQILALGSNITPEALHEIFSCNLRVHNIAIKDAKLRTFITKDSERNDMVMHVYDTTYGVIKRGVDNLVIIDDSIVRGTTLKKSILAILDRLGPKKIVVVSSAPQIRYPDCYGIDMAKIGDFIAFQAAIALLKDTGKIGLLDELYQKALAQRDLPKEEIVNVIKEIYKPFTPEQISKKIGELVRPENMNAEIEVIFQSIENLHIACPRNLGDWYFTGNYPTPGGNKVVNNSFINYIEGNNKRAY